MNEGGGKERRPQPVADEPSPKDITAITPDKASQILKLLEQLGRMTASDDEEASRGKEHKFWQTQPVVHTDAGEAESDGPINPSVSPSKVPREPQSLPEEFDWCTVDLENPQEQTELYQLLNLNYVEDQESLFRFDYPVNFLEWALKAPGWRREWHVGVRVAASKRLVAFISAIPTTIKVRERVIQSVEVNFLCIHKRLRSKRLAPLLIREVTRRVNLQGLFQALYTAGAELPGALCKVRYYHRPINFKKLVEVGFTMVPLGKSIDQMVLRYHLAKEHQLGSNFRPMAAADIPQVSQILANSQSRFALHTLYSEEECRHWLLPRDNIIYSYVLEADDGLVSDFISFYSLPSTVVANPLHDRINVAYLFYYSASSPARLVKLVHAALTAARDLGFDVFNCVEIMDNATFLNELKFGEGDGCLHYYLYNWRTKPFEPSDTAVVML